MDDVLGDLGACAIALGKYEQAAQFAKESLSISQQVFGYDRAWSLRVLGEAAFGMGDFQQARKHLGMALKDLVQKRQGYIFLALVDIAKVLNFSGETDRALELLVFVLLHPASWQMARDWATPLIAELEAKLPPKVVAATLERGRARDLGSTVTELLEELRESA